MAEWRISLTFDVDWAPEAVIADTIELLEAYSACGTFFATHDSAVLQAANCDRYEIAIHPNFNPTLAGNGPACGQVIDELLQIYPDSRGSRSHSLTVSSLILDHCVNAGLAYESSIFVPAEIPPFEDCNGLWRIPFSRSDIQSLVQASALDCRLPPGTGVVFSFHPIHLFLNTDTVERYSAVKHLYQDAKALREHRNKTAPGARDWLIRILETAATAGVETVRQADILDQLLNVG